MARMILTRLVAMLIAIAMLFAPMAMNRAMAAAPASSHAQMANEAHCLPAADQGAEEDGPDRCCAATCAATVVAPSGFAVRPLHNRLAQPVALTSIPRGVLGEIETPPPRSA